VGTEEKSRLNKSFIRWLCVACWKPYVNKQSLSDFRYISSGLFTTGIQYMFI